MAVPNTIGSIAAICTTGAFVPQVVKVRKQGGEDLSYLMLGIYFVGVALWFVYGLMLHAPAMIWANSITALLVAVAILLKATHANRTRAKIARAAAQPSPESEFGD